MVNEHSHFLINVLTAAAAITASSIMVDWCALTGSITCCKARTHTHTYGRNGWKLQKCSTVWRGKDKPSCDLMAWNALFWKTEQERVILLCCVCACSCSALFSPSATPHPPSLQHFLPSAHPRSGNLDNPGCIAKTNVKHHQPAVAVGASLLSAHSVCVCRCVYKCLYHTVCLSLVCFSFGWYFFNTLKM